MAAQTALAGKTANDQVKAANDAVKAFIDKTEADFSRVVKCDYKAATNTLVCNKALAISGAEVSSIEVSGLPPDRQVTLSASAAGESNDQLVDPASDSITIPSGHSGSAAIDVYLLRKFKKSYRADLSYASGCAKAIEKPEEGKGPKLSEEAQAAFAMRSLRDFDSDESPNWKAGDPCNTYLAKRTPPRLKLVVAGTAPSILIEVNVEDMGVSFPIEIGYSRWGVSTGGFFAITPLADEEIKTVPTTTAGMVKIVQIAGGRDIRPDTGIFLNLVPRNYPLLGIGIGFSSNDKEPNTIYFGPSMRLTTFRDRGVASFSIGGTLRSVKRFPGLKEGGDPISATDPLLQGKSQYKLAPYAIIQLGFAFGRIPGGGDSN